MRLLNLTTNEIYDFTKDEIRIGRAGDNDIILNYSNISAHHARILRKAKGFYLEDLNSSNGTYFRNKSITTVHLLSQDIFRIGNIELKYIESDAGYIHKEETVSDNLTYGVNGHNSAPDPHHVNRTDSPPVEKSRNKKNIFPTGNRRWIMIGSGVILFLIFVLMFYFLYPYNDVQTGKIVTCKHCGKDFINDVKTISVSRLDINKYSVEKRTDYCPECGSQPVTYYLHYKCMNCGKEYNTVQRVAERRTEPSDQTFSEGYCQTGCQILGETKGAIGKTKEAVDDFLEKYIP